MERLQRLEPFFSDHAETTGTGHRIGVAEIRGDKKLQLVSAAFGLCQFKVQCSEFKVNFRIDALKPPCTMGSWSPTVSALAVSVICIPEIVSALSAGGANAKFQLKSTEMPRHRYFRTPTTLLSLGLLRK